VPLSFENLKQNCGFLIKKGVDVETESGEVLETMTVRTDLPSIEDYCHKRITGRVIPEVGIALRWPVISEDLKDVERIHTLDGDDACEKTKLTHTTIVTSINKNEENKVRSILLLWPEGYTCNTRFFNYSSDNWELKTRLLVDGYKVTDQRGREHNIITKKLVWWKVVIDTEETRRTQEEEKEDPDSQVLAKLANLGV